MHDLSELVRLNFSVQCVILALQIVQLVIAIVVWRKTHQLRQQLLTIRDTLTEISEARASEPIDWTVPSRRS